MGSEGLEESDKDAHRSKILLHFECHCEDSPTPQGNRTICVKQSQIAFIRINCAKEESVSFSYQ